MERLTVNTGDVYGKLTIIKEIESVKTARSSIKRRFLCQCECGNTSTPSLSGLRSGNTTSCGCNTLKKFKERVTKHKLSTHELYDTWRSMMQRCNNPKNTNYHYYGSRGIKVCDEWENVETFIKDMYPSFQKGLTLDRIDNNKGYSKYNCRWSTMEEQSHNKSSNRILTYNNKQYTMKQLSDKLNLDYDSLKRNLNNGFSIEESIIKSTK